MVFFWQWAIWLVYHQKIMKHPPPLPPKKLLFYIYIVLHSHVKLYKCIDFYTYTCLYDFT
jgi:hypothetical protein